MKKYNRLLVLSVIFLISLIIVDFFVAREHPYFIWDKIPGFNAFFGFVSCVLIIFVSLFIGKFIIRKEDYYDK